ncbi:uncharacterized protein LOC123305559 [Chrysoperla carnea]|uniref:uncharacterized protein LOC123305559 n=1 Tax=Chrysoperla carnea TaxID=189513 RepID=UPI001D08CB4D|nr:uncharacterized protein LOC123305559 [Chrysoperla carnea]
MIYRQIIRSFIDYGSFLLSPLSNQRSLRLDRVQFQTLRIALGQMRSCPTNSLLIEAADAPLTVRRLYLAKKFFLNQYSSLSHPLIPKLIRLNNHCTNSPYWRNKELPLLVVAYRVFGIIPIYQSLLPPFFSFEFVSRYSKIPVFVDCGLDKNDTVYGSIFVNSTFNNYLDSILPNYTFIFTDASKLDADARVGVAYHCSSSAHSASLSISKFFSIFSAECVAILEALSYVESEGIKKAAIVSDSLSSLSLLKQNSISSKTPFLIVLIKNTVLKLIQNRFSVAFVWCPSHIGIRGNEFVDMLARDAVQNGAEDNSPPPAQDLWAVCRKSMLNDWNQIWRNSTKGRKLYALQPAPALQTWFHEWDVGRKNITTIGRLRTGHNSLPAHLHKINVVPDTNCRCGYPYCDINHVIFACPLFNQHRPMLLSSLARMGVFGPYFIPHLLSLNNYDILSTICSFLNKTQLPI